MRKHLLVALIVAVAGILSSCPAMGQETVRKGGSVPITFVPPPIEGAVYSIGIYEVKSGKLARRLCEAARQETFKVGLNGLVTSWDGRDEEGKPLPPGRYAARGYAVGAMEVEGLDVLGNDWAADDDRLRIARVDSIVFVPDDGGIAVAGRTPWGHLQVARYGGEKTAFLWASDRGFGTPTASVFTLSLPQGGKYLRASSDAGPSDFRLASGEQEMPPGREGSPEAVAPVSGRERTTWKIEEGVVSQYSASGERLRNLAPKEEDPVPVAVATGPESDRIYLLEEAEGVQRVRGLAPVETKEEDGRRVSTWLTFFERTVRRADPSLGREPASTAHGSGTPVEVMLEENALAPGKRARVKLSGAFDAKGSYLATADGLRLRQISAREHLRAVSLMKGKEGLLFDETDGAAWDRFGIRGAGKLMAFDAGEFEIDAAGEKPVTEKVPEPDL